MSNFILNDVWKLSQSKGSTRLVLLSLADQANDDGYCWPSVGSIAKRCRISERSVQDHLRVLVSELREVEREDRPGRSTVYRVVIPQVGGATSAGVRDLHPEESAPGGAAHRRGGVQDSAPRTIREPSPTPKGSRKKSETSLPDNWEPLPRHGEFVSSNGLDLAVQAQRFRNDALAKDRRYVLWDRAFDNWLIKAAEWAKPATVTPIRQSAKKPYETPPAPDRESLPW